MNTATHSDRLCRLPEVEQKTGLKKSAIYAAIQRGQFPAPVKVGRRTVAWPLSHIESWIAEVISGRNASASSNKLPISSNVAPSILFDFSEATDYAGLPVVRLDGRRAPLFDLPALIFEDGKLRAEAARNFGWTLGIATLAHLLHHPPGQDGSSLVTVIMRHGGESFNLAAQSYFSCLEFAMWNAVVRERPTIHGPALGYSELEALSNSEIERWLRQILDCGRLNSDFTGTSRATS